MRVLAASLFSMLATVALGCGGKALYEDVPDPTAHWDAGVSTDDDAASGNDAAPGDDASSEPSPEPCSLQEVVVGTFSPNAPGLAVLNGPAAVGIGRGFVLGVAEAHSNVAGIALTSLSLQGQSKPVWHVADEACGQPKALGSPAMAWSESAGEGFAALIGPDCLTSPQLQVLTFDSAGQSTEQVLYQIPSELTVGPGSVALAPSTNHYLLAGSADGLPALYRFKGAKVLAELSPAPGISQVRGMLQLAASDRMLAMLDRAESDHGSTLTLRASEEDEEAHVALLPAAHAGALAAIGDRALVVLASQSGLGWHVVQMNGPEYHGELTETRFEAVATAVAGPYAVIAAAGNGAIELHRTRLGETGLRLVGEPKPLSVQVPSGSALAGSKLTAAASQGRVVVAWLYDTLTDDNDAPTGGYALLDCAQDE